MPKGHTNNPLGNKRAKGSGKHRKITPMQQMVVNNYFGVSKFNKTDALRRAGYKHPNHMLYVFDIPVVKAEIDRRLVVLQKKYEVTYENVMEEAMRIVKSRVTDYARTDEKGNLYFDFSETTLDELAAIGEVTVEEFIDHYEDVLVEDEDGGTRTEKEPVRVKRIKVKPWSKLQAMDLVLRHGGLSKEKVPTVQIELVERLRSARAKVKPRQKEGDSGEGADS